MYSSEPAGGTYLTLFSLTAHLLVWNRIILPDTSSPTLDNLVGADPAGYTDLVDDVSWHWDQIFAGAALMTLLSVGAELAASRKRQSSWSE